MLDKDTLHDMIWIHSQWKRRLRQAIECRDSRFSVEMVRNDKVCEFGRWLETSTAKRLSNHAELLQLHHQFHQQAGQILLLALDGHHQAALDAMELGSCFNQLTARLINALSALAHEAA